MSDDRCPVRWTGRQAVVTLPEHIDITNSGQIREQLLDLVNRGATVLIADMTGTVSCDYGGAEALSRAYQRASASGAQLRVTVTAPAVRRVLEASGLDRLVSIYPSVEDAVAAGAPGVIPPTARRRAAVPPDRSQTAGITPAVLWRLIDALGDAVLLSGGDGVLVLANRRAEDMFGYGLDELIGQPVESLVPEGLRASHVSLRDGYMREPTARPMSARARLVGLRKDGSTFPVRVSLDPVPTTTGLFILAVIRDITREQPRADLADLARAAATGDQAQRGRELLDRVVNGLLHVGLSLEAAIDLPHDVAMQRITDALRRLDDTIREIHDHVFARRDQNGAADPGPDRTG